ARVCRHGAPYDERAGSGDRRHVRDHVAPGPRNAGRGGSSETWYRSMTRPIRVLIADDHPLFRGGLRALLEAIADTEVVGEAATGEEAITTALALCPDVIVMDIN